MNTPSRRLVGWLLTTCIGALLLGAYGVLTFICREPHLEGRPVSSWIRDLSQGGLGPSEAALQLFHRQGANAVPGLVSVIERRRSAFAFRIKKLPFYRLMPHRIAQWVQERTTMPEVDRAWALRMCALIGVGARGANGALATALTDENPFIRGAAAKALAATQGDPATILPMIGRLLSDPYPGVRSQAAMALGEYHHSARAMVPRLRSMTNDPESNVAFSARLALAMIETPDRVASTTNDLGEISYRLQQ